MPLCDIILNKSDETYYPGDTLTGYVCIGNAKPMKARSVTISWSGVSRTSMGISKPTFKKSWLSGSELLWVPKDAKSDLPAGVHEFPFSINLPMDCPPTHKMRNTENAYKLEVVIDRPWRLNTTVEKKIIVTKKLDTTWKTGSFSKTFRSGWIFNSGPVTMEVFCQTTAQPGETIDLNFKVINDSSTTVTRLYTYFDKETHHHSRCQHTPCKSFYTTSCPLSKSERGYNYEILQRTKYTKVNVPPYSEQDIIVPFVVPKKATTPNFANGLMAFGYYLAVGFYVRGSLYTDKFAIGMDIGEEKKAEPKKKTKKTKKQEALGTAPPPYSK